MALFRRILVPVDNSPYSLDAVKLAAQLAKIHRSEIKLLHVLDTSVFEQLVRFSSKDKKTIREALYQEACGFLADMKQEAQKEAIPIEVAITQGTPHEEILAEANIWGAELIVMGKLGRRGVRSILLGSVAERVIEFSEIPVLIVK